jgi:TRAP transporter TAXI family solute receptor
MGKMKDRNFLKKAFLGLSLCLLIFFLGLPGEVPAVEKTFISIGTAGTGGLWYPTGAALSQILNKYLGDKVKATAVTSRGGTENLLAINKKERLMGFDLALDVYNGYTGTGMYKDKGPYKKAALGFMPAQALCFNVWTTKEKGIKTIADIKGKRLAVPAPGASARVYSDFLYRADGLDIDKDVKLSHGNMSEMCDMLTMGQIDVASWQTGLRASALLSFAETRNIAFVSFPDGAIRKTAKQFPGLIPYEIPANTYKGQNSPAKTIGVPIALIIYPDLDTELVYQMAKAVWEHIEELYASVESMREVKWDGSLYEQMPVPYHPGVMKYLREKNLPGIKEFEIKIKKAEDLRKKNLAR